MATEQYLLKNSKDLGDPYQLRIPMEVRFWIYLIPNIMSIFASFFALYHLVFDRPLLQALNNHIIIILLSIGLIYEMTSVPLMLYWFMHGEAWINTLTYTFAHFWTFIDYFCYSSQLIGFAWASIERHILIFHNQWVATAKKRFFVHYLPLIIYLVYCITYYFGFIVFPFCPEYILASPFNGVPISCVLFDPIFHKYDTISHQFMPVALIISLSLALFIRIVRQKSRLNRSVEWRKQRKMTIQLLSISVLYLIFMGPRTVLQFWIFIGFDANDVMVLFFHSAFFANYITFFFPVVCCGSMPELKKKLNQLLFWRSELTSVAPISTMATRTINKQQARETAVNV